MDKSAEIARAAIEIVTGLAGRRQWTPTDPEFFARLERFAATLALWGARLNLTAAPGDPAEIAFHIIDSLTPVLPIVGPRAFSLEADPATLFAAGTRVLDLGSGAGFPALILAAATAADFMLLEARRKRASFLAVAIAAMGLGNARVEAARRDAATLQPSFDVVTARAFGEPEMVFATAAAGLRPGGHAILFAGAAQRLAIERAAAGAFDRLELIDYEVARGGGPSGAAGSAAHLLAVARRKP